MSAFLKSIRNGASHIKSTPDFNLKIDNIKNTSSGVSSIDDVFKDLNYKQVGDEVHINDARLRDLEGDFRVGNVISGLNKANVATTISAGDEALFRNAISKDVPDLDIKNMEMKINSAKKFHSDLDVKSTSGADLEAKLSPSSKEKTKSLWSKIVKVAAGSGIAVGLFTAAYLTDNIFDDIHNAASARNGCFLVSKKTNVEACKIVSKSCGYPTASASSSQVCSTDLIDKLQYNIYIMTHHIEDTADSTAIDELVTLGCEWTSGMTADQVLAIENNVPVLMQYYTTKYPTLASVPFVACDVVTNYQGCIACDPTQPTISKLFTSTETMDSNVVYKCISNTSAIEAITDIATSMGVDILSTSGDSISGSFQGNFFIALVILLGLIALIAIVLKFSSGNKSTTQQFSNPAPASVPPQPSTSSYQN